MKKRILSMLLAVVSVLSLGAAACAADVSPLWVDVAAVEADLSFSAQKAACDVTIKGTNGTTKIVADITMQKLNSKGDYEDVVFFPTQTSSGPTLTYATITPALTTGTYRLKVVATAYDSSGPGETVTNYSSPAVCS